MLVMERWVSGLNQRFTKPPFLCWNREFESRSFRKKVKTSESAKNGEGIAESGGRGGIPP